MRRVILTILVIVLLLAPAVSAQDNTPTPEYQNYTVVQGDTLGRISARFNTTTRAIMEANGLTDPNLIFAGMILKIPVATPTSAAPTATVAPPTEPVVTTPTATPSPAPPTPPPIPFDLGSEIFSFDHFGTLSEAGITWVKVQLRWRLGDSSASAQLAINQAHSSGLRILLQIVGDPQEMGSNQATYLNRFGTYLGEVAALAPDAIEVWGDMNAETGWVRGQIDPAAYTEMLQTAFAAIKRANPTVLVVSGALAQLPAFDNECGPDGCDDLRYLGGMAAAGADKSADCIGMSYTVGAVSPHESSGDPRGDQFIYYYSTVVSVYAGIFPDKPLCFTRIGYLVPSDGSAGTTAEQRAEWLAQAALLARQSGRIRLFIAYNLDATIGAPADYAILGADGGCLPCAALSAAMRMR